MKINLSDLLTGNIRKHNILQFVRQKFNLNIFQCFSALIFFIILILTDNANAQGKTINIGRHEPAGNGFVLDNVVMEVTTNFSDFYEYNEIYVWVKVKSASITGYKYKEKIYTEYICNYTLPTTCIFKISGSITNKGTIIDKFSEVLIGNIGSARVYTIKKDQNVDPQSFQATNVKIFSTENSVINKRLENCLNESSGKSSSETISPKTTSSSGNNSSTSSTGNSGSYNSSSSSGNTVKSSSTGSPTPTREELMQRHKGQNQSTQKSSIDKEREREEFHRKHVEKNNSRYNQTNSGSGNNTQESISTPSHSAQSSENKNPEYEPEENEEPSSPSPSNNTASTTSAEEMARLAQNMYSYNQAMQRAKKAETYGDIEGALSGYQEAYRHRPTAENKQKLNEVQLQKSMQDFGRAMVDAFHDPNKTFREWDENKKTNISNINHRIKKCNLSNSKLMVYNYLIHKNFTAKTDIKFPNISRIRQAEISESPENALKELNKKGKITAYDSIYVIVFNARGESYRSTPKEFVTHSTSFSILPSALINSKYPMPYMEVYVSKIIALPAAPFAQNPYNATAKLHEIMKLDIGNTKAPLMVAATSRSSAEVFHKMLTTKTLDETIIKAKKIWLDISEITEPALIKAFVRAGANINTKLEKSGNTALHLSAYEKDTKRLKLLLALGASKDAINNNGETPLAVAASAGNKAAVEALLKAGTNPNVAGKGGNGYIQNTPLALANNSGYSEIAEIIKIYGGKTEPTFTAQTSLAMPVPEIEKEQQTRELESWFSLELFGAKLDRYIAGKAIYNETFNRSEAVSTRINGLYAENEDHYLHLAQGPGEDYKYIDFPMAGTPKNFILKTHIEQVDGSANEGISIVLQKDNFLVEYRLILSGDKPKYRVASLLPGSATAMPVRDWTTLPKEIIGRSGGFIRINVMDGKHEIWYQNNLLITHSFSNHPGFNKIRIGAGPKTHFKISNIGVMELNPLPPLTDRFKLIGGMTLNSAKMVPVEGSSMSINRNYTDVNPGLGFKLGGAAELPAGDVVSLEASAAFLHQRFTMVGRQDFTWNNSTNGISTFTPTTDISLTYLNTQALIRFNLPVHFYFGAGMFFDVALSGKGVINDMGPTETIIDLFEQERYNRLNIGGLLEAGYTFKAFKNNFFDVFVSYAAGWTNLEKQEYQTYEKLKHRSFTFGLKYYVKHDGFRWFM